MTDLSRPGRRNAWDGGGGGSLAVRLAPFAVSRLRRVVSLRRQELQCSSLACSIFDCYTFEFCRISRLRDWGPIRGPIRQGSTDVLRQTQFSRRLIVVKVLPLEKKIEEEGNSAQ